MLVVLATFVRGGVIVAGAGDGELDRRPRKTALARNRLPATTRQVLLASPVNSHWSTFDPAIAFGACSFSMIESAK